MLGKIKGKRRRGQKGMVGWHHQLNGHEFERAPGVGDGQRSLAGCSPWHRKELGMTWQLKTTTTTITLNDTLNDIILNDIIIVSLKGKN